MSISDSLAAVLTRRQLLIVLDNCEHVLAAVAELCGALLPAADDIRILATSREPVGVAGETRYRLAPLTLPGGPGQPVGACLRGQVTAVLLGEGCGDVRVSMHGLVLSARAGTSRRSTPRLRRRRRRRAEARLPLLRAADAGG
jgi:hypothetical protein